MPTLHYFYILMHLKKKPVYFLVAALLMLLLSYPLLTIANSTYTVAGIPAFYVYTGVLWLSGIIFLMIRSVIESKPNSNQHE